MADETKDASMADIKISEEVKSEPVTVKEENKPAEEEYEDLDAVSLM